MLTKTVLSTADLTALLDSVFEYNRRGQVSELLFYDDDGNLLPVARVEAVSEGAGLAVRTRPDPTPGEQAAASMYRPILNPTAVPQPESLEHLAAALER